MNHSSTSTATIAPPAETRIEKNARDTAAFTASSDDAVVEDRDRLAEVVVHDRVVVDVRAAEDGAHPVELLAVVERRARRARQLAADDALVVHA